MSAPIRVQICSERFLSRFGLDRILLLAADHFRAQGAEVSLAALRADPSLVAELGFNVSIAPVPPGYDMQATETFATRFILNEWLSQRPDVLLIGGFPFFDLAARSAMFGVASCYQDVGAVPHDGLPANMAATQQELRRIRALTMPFVDLLLPISDFIRMSQTERDRGHTRGVRTVLLGTDHLPVNAPASDDALVSRLRSEKAKGVRLILSLGRFEDSGYKNSAAGYAIVCKLRDEGHDVKLLILSRPEHITVPVDLADLTILLGNPSDAVLVAVMRECDLGLSTSLWEGFNLPLAEMQQIGKPVLAFSVGAHPEVVADPWFLCQDEAQMIEKARILMGAGTLPPVRSLDKLADYPARLPWARTLERWWEEISALARWNRDRPLPRSGQRLVFIDVTNSTTDPANSGVIRVTRQISRRLQQHPGLDVVLVRWNHERHCYTLIDPNSSQLSNFGGPEDFHHIFYNPETAHIAPDRLLYGTDPRIPIAPVLFLPEVCLDGSLASRINWAKNYGLFVSTVLHDLIPYYHVEYCTRDVIEGYASYIPQILGADQILTNSNYTLMELTRYVEEHRAQMPAEAKAIWLPAQFAHAERVRTSLSPRGEIKILCVSTIEPRKNHKRLVEAYRCLVERRRDLRLKLVLVGNRYVGADELVSQIEAAAREGASIEWRGILTDQELQAEYTTSRFTIYPSVLEGYGMPIMESLWLGKPVICSDSGVMAELAQPGGCLTTDVHDIDAISNAMERLATDDNLLQRLTAEIFTRHLSDWTAYADQIGDELFGLYNPFPRPAATENVATRCHK